MIARRAWLLAVLAACGDDAMQVIDAPVIDAPAGPDPEGRIARFLLDDDPTDGVRAELGGDGRCRRCPRLVEGRRGGAVAYDGTGEIILAPSVPLTGQLTGAAWVRAASLQPEAACIIGVPTVGFRNSWQLCLTGPLGLQMCMGELAGSGDCERTAPGLLTIGQWHHLAITFDGAILRGYLDSAEVLASPRIFEASDQELVIGGDLDFGAPIAFFTGSIDDVRVWNRALSAAEIAEEVTR